MVRECIGLVACCGQKLEGRHPAQDIYVSSLFRKSRTWVMAHCSQWFILSAKFGLLAPSQEIETYDVTLNAMSAADRRAWARRVREQLEPFAAERFIVLAGERYCAGLTGLDVKRPLQGMGIGRQLAWLTQQNARP
ncbi:DUF6884 domain-containing protein [Aromatoleum evansii]|uniref:DUF6884 domain-containing protein n=1 Tax=Aromatoleum evansii TaxID=59406 RepID=UPI00145EDF59|nr:DUF6884 domain-containing protein [Aromatoleum evansii]NMG29569.1 hypothetical protein [Aromatoleum evansii]